LLTWLAVALTDASGVGGQYSTVMRQLHPSQ
jgi:hypothetical protein